MSIQPNMFPTLNFWVPIRGNKWQVLNLLSKPNEISLVVGLDDGWDVFRRYTNYLRVAFKTRCIYWNEIFNRFWDVR